MILIAKKQRLARQSAKNLIDFENIVVDTDFGGAVSFRSIHDGSNHLSSEPEDNIIDDMAGAINSNIKNDDESGSIKKDSLVR